MNISKRNHKILRLVMEFYQVCSWIYFLPNLCVFADMKLMKKFSIGRESLVFSDLFNKMSRMQNLRTEMVM